MSGGPLFGFKSGALGGIRTHGLCLRRAALYPLSYKRVIVCAPRDSSLPFSPVGRWELDLAVYFTCFGAEGGI